MQVSTWLLDISGASFSAGKDLIFVIINFLIDCPNCPFDS
ncbi:hypothetical protein PALB_34390 [Pseudoalteromonas luteoviolacea B = ATCC 29581]|nr:hypothetical protein PALB_34390 [Pseudoalteromonas luteoviolacea B = ATCC 29581]